MATSNELPPPVAGRATPEWHGDEDELLLWRAERQLAERLLQEARDNDEDDEQELPPGNQQQATQLCEDARRRSLSSPLALGDLSPRRDESQGEEEQGGDRLTATALARRDRGTDAARKRQRTGAFASTSAASLPSDVTTSASRRARHLAG
ncbi:hypothetical protein BDZ90DRAFT_262881 [Jaminaea rosea]|uniref:Uncharacterized protein n=1 Tax=Jaminaea rosea TaxID=1569628 RepID=A0A316UKX9_9BASI|nr:hypothetical protein BDZ90DRAFT_262881 [Jaminaea rosea]PWN25031.1 hypothetical protein BDZ90DRAFT_262881 [Jaminaea rosea]